jgi:hypothetical protein
MLKILRKPVFFSLAFLFAFCVSAGAFIWFVLAPDSLAGAEARQAWAPSASAPPPQSAGDSPANPVEQPAPVQTDSAPRYFQLATDPVWRNAGGDESLNTASPWPDVPITGSEPYKASSLPPNIPLSQHSASNGPAPEPATLVLMASGISAIAGAAFLRRKRATRKETP